MLPAGPLMMEHRLIEHMISVISRELKRIKQNKVIDVNFIDTMVDFIRIYADKCHHGKEEDILFRDLAKKRLSQEHKKTMEELIQEHVYGRNTVAKLVETRKQYQEGKQEVLEEIVKYIEALVEFYPKHIDKEDNRFFLPAMDYFTKDELDTMLREMWEFDKKMIHKKYREVVDKLEVQG